MRKIKSEFACRPIFFLGIVVSLVMCLYVNLFYRSPELPFREKEQVSLSGKIVDKDLTEQGTINSFYIKGEYGFRVFISNMELSPSSVPLGATVTLSGKFRSFSTPTNPGEYSFKSYYEVRGYQFYVNLSEMHIESLPHFPLREWFFSLRSYFTSSIRENCPLEGGTINTLIFGDKSGLDSERKNMYKATGLSHFLVISGLHISVAGGGIYAALRRTGIRRGRAALAGISIILLYAGIVGFTVSVIRAVVMFIVRLTADIINRSYDMLTALSLGAIITLISNPLWIKDSAFLYSYVSVLSIGLYMTYSMTWEEGFQKSILARKSGKDKILTLIKLRFPIPLVIYLSLLPLSLYFQSYSNMLSIPMNVILGFLTTPIILCGTLAFLFGLIGLPFLPSLFDYFCAILLRIIDICSSICQKWSAFKISFKPSVSAILIYYTVLLIFILTMIHRASLCDSMVVMLTAVLFLATPIDPGLNVSFLDVGQGDCIVIKTGPHRGIVNDCGSSSRSEVGQYVLLPYLLSQGITEISDIYISHGDSDHLNGIQYLLTEEARAFLKVDRIVMPALDESVYSSELIEIYNLAVKHNIPVMFLSSGDFVSYGSCNVRCLWPDSRKLTGESNTDSMVLLFTSGNFDMLLTGDCTRDTEKSLIDYFVMSTSIDLLKCAHHGSSSSSSPDFINTINPLLSVISAGRNNPYGHPHKEVLTTLENAGTKILRTDTCGAISISVMNHRFKYKTYIPETD